MPKEYHWRRVLPSVTPIPRGHQVQESRRSRSVYSVSFIMYFRRLITTAYRYRSDQHGMTESLLILCHLTKTVKHHSGT